MNIRRMHSQLFKHFSLVSFFLFCSLVSSLARAETYNIGVVMDAKGDWTSSLIDTLRTQLEGLSSSELNIQLKEEHIYASNWDYSSVQENLRKAVRNKNIDAVVAVGLISSDSTLKVRTSKPIIASSVIEPETQGFIIDEDGHSANKNVHFLYTQVRVEKELERFAKAISAKKLGLIDKTLKQIDLF